MSFAGFFRMRAAISGRNLAFPFQSIDVPRPMHLPPAFIDAHNKSNHPHD